MNVDLIYAAKSTKDTKDSTGRQLARITKQIQAEGREPYGRPYKDEAASGYHGNRGKDLAEAMAEAERLAAEGHQVRLWVDHSDRTSRGDGVEARHTVEVMLWARKANVELRSVRDPETFRTISSAAAMGDRNHGDSQVKSERVAEGLAVRREQGGYHGGPEAYGLAYPVDPDQPTRQMPDGTTRRNTRSWMPLEHHPTEAAVVARIFQLVLDGLGVNAIAVVLNDDGVPTKLGGKWHGGSVRQIVRNAIYISRTKDGYPMAHAPVIDTDTWDRAQAILDRRATGPGKGGRRTTNPALFINGHLRCGTCGGPMGYRSKPNRSGGRSERYICGTREHDRKGCTQTPVRVPELEGAVLETFRRRALTRSSALTEWQATYEADLAYVTGLRKDAEREVAKVQARMATAQEAFLDGHLSPERYEPMAERLEADLAAAEAQAEQMAAREQTVAVRASSQIHDAFSEAMQALGHAADRALRGELPMDGVRESLRALFPAPVYRDGHVHLGDPAPEYVALLVDDELEGAAGEPILDRLKASAATGVLSLPSTSVVAPIPVPLEDR